MDNRNSTNNNNPSMDTTREQRHQQLANMHPPQQPPLRHHPSAVVSSSYQRRWSAHHHPRRHSLAARRSLLLLRLGGRRRRDPRTGEGWARWMITSRSRRRRVGNWIMLLAGRTHQYRRRQWEVLQRVGRPMPCRRRRLMGKRRLRWVRVSGLLSNIRRTLTRQELDDTQGVVFTTIKSQDISTLLTISSK